METCKTLIITAITALFLVGCAKNESIVRSGSDAISFSGYTGRALTKSYADYEVNNGYHVYAYLGSNEYFNDTFENNQAKSTGNPQKIYYWPTSISSTNKLTFYAVAPKETTLSSGYKISAFNAASGGTDLVIAKSIDYTAKADKVDLKFKHALAKVNSFTLQSKTTDTPDGSATADYKYNVTALKITANTVGTCSIATGEPVWSSLGTSGDYTYVSSTKSFDGDKTLSVTTPVNAIIPQEVTITVTYNITFGEEIVFGSVTKTGTLSLAAGNAYSIKITLTNDNSPIIFNAEETEWNETSYETSHYIDEYGIDQGKGIQIGNVVWAPVNCGYHKEKHKYGKLYQWGRKDGCGYVEDKSTYNDAGGIIQDVLSQGPIAEESEDPSTFYYYNDWNADWLTPKNDNRWDSSGNSSSTNNLSPIKTENDPCPLGWRVPTYAEFNALLGGGPKKDKENPNRQTDNREGSPTKGMLGYFYDGTSTMLPTDGVFLPCAGYRTSTDGKSFIRPSAGYYWTSSVNGKRAYLLTETVYAGSGRCSEIRDAVRAMGCAVRCVQDKDNRLIFGEKQE